MNETSTKKNSLCLILFWSILGIIFSLLFLKIYYINAIISKGALTIIELNIAVFSYIYDFVIFILFLVLVAFFNEIKAKKQKIFQNRKVILSAFLLSIFIIIIVFISNAKAERDIMIEGDFFGKNQQTQILKEFNI